MSASILGIDINGPLSSIWPLVTLPSLDLINGLTAAFSIDIAFFGTAIVGTGLSGVFFALGWLSWWRKQTSSRRSSGRSEAMTHALLEVSRVLNASLDLQTVLNEILLQLYQLIPYYSASVLLLNDRGGLDVASHRGEDTETHLVDMFRAEETSAARDVILQISPLIIPDTSQDERWSAMPGSKIRSWMGLPLRVFDRAVGVLNVNSDMPFRFTDEDVELAKAFSDQASVALQNARLHEREVKRLEDELKVARNIQSSLLPSVTPDVSELEIAVESLPAQQVSGDYFQFVPLPDGRIGIFVGDVSGKGMPAAMIMAVITTALRDEVIRHREPGQLLNTLNERLLERLLQNQMNCALLAAIFDPATYHLAISNAGMVQPYWRNGSQVWDFLDVGGYPLGASQRSNYSAKVIDFAPGSLMVLFSDGIIEAQDARGEFFGFERFEKLLDSMPSTITASEAVRQILHAVENHLEGIERQDDITVMVIRGVEVAKGTQHGPAMPDEIVEAMMPGALSGGVKPHALRDTYANIATAAPQRRTAPGEDGYLPPRENVELFLPSILGYEMIARSAAEALAVQMGFSDDRINDLKTAIAEACMNAIEHGNLEDRSTSVRVLLSVSANRLEARVVDRGRRPLPDPFPVPGAGNNSRGWGMFFIQNLMDEVEVQKTPDGNMIRMSLFLGKDDEFYAQIEPSPDASEWVDQNE